MAAGELLLKEKPLLTMTTPHTPKTLAKYVAELRQKVHDDDNDDDGDTDDDDDDFDDDDAPHSKEYRVICRRASTNVGVHT